MSRISIGSVRRDMKGDAQDLYRLEWSWCDVWIISSEDLRNDVGIRWFLTCTNNANTCAWVLHYSTGESAQRYKKRIRASPETKLCSTTSISDPPVICDNAKKYPSVMISTFTAAAAASRSRVLIPNVTMQLQEEWPSINITSYLNLMNQRRNFLSTLSITRVIDSCVRHSYGRGLPLAHERWVNRMNYFSPRVYSSH